MLPFEDALVYFPKPYDGSEIWNPPDLEFEDAWFQAADGTRLHGWFCPHAAPRAVVLLAHGNAGHLAGWIDVLRLWQEELRTSIMIFDYRGFGRSEGKPSEAGLMQDGRAARAWLARRVGIADREIALYGMSIGGAVAVDLATEGARGLVLENTFTSLPDVAAHLYPFLPVKRLMRNRYDSLSKIGRYEGPLLMCHGEADATVPFALGRKLFEAAKEPKEFFVIPGGEHNDPPPAEYYQRLDRFLDGLTLGGAR